MGRTLDANELLAGSACGKRQRGRPLNSVVRPHPRTMSREQSPTNNLIIGVAWFDREQWTRLTQVVPDRSALDDTFEQWERSARNALARMRADGLRAEAVPINVEQLLAWCMLQGLKPDGKARANYAAYLIKRKTGEV